MRLLYRARQFFRALFASFRPLDGAEQAEARAILSGNAWLLFAAMPRSDQRHSLNVLHGLNQGRPLVAANGPVELLEAALLHDCAKHVNGVRLWHRVAAVLFKAFWPAILHDWGTGAAPARRTWRYPFWAYANHPALGAELAARAGCPPAAVWLICHHQDAIDPAGGLGAVDDRLTMLAALQAADDDN